MTKQEQLLSWLNDAHMMEEEIVRVLESHVADADDYPEVKQIIANHIDQTKDQASRLKQRIEKIGGDASGMKSGLGAIMGKMSGASTEMHDDKVIKNALLEYGTEHFEMACYHSLKAAAEAVGDSETAAMAQEIHDEEKEMAKLLHDSLP